MNILTRIKGIIFSPRKEWFEISQEVPHTQKLIVGYVLPLSLLSAAASFIGYGFIGHEVLGVEFTGVDWGIYHALTHLLGDIISVVISTYVIDALASKFESEKNIGRSLQLVVYSFTPAWIGGLLALIPSLALLGSLIGLYGLYLLYIGMPILKKTPSKHLTGYFIATLVITILIQLVVGYFMGNILMGALGLSYEGA